jgi:hypothetical protein
MTSVALTEQTCAFARADDDSSALVVFNDDAAPAELEIDVGPVVSRLAEGRMLRERRGAAPAVRVAKGRIKAVLPARTALLRVPEEARP